MFHGLGDHFIELGFWCVQKLLLQHLGMDYMIANESEYDPLLQKLLIPHKICEMGHCAKEWIIVYQDREWPWFE